MKPFLIPFAESLAVPLLLCALSFGQNPAQPIQQDEDNVVGRQLIAWSQMQKPQPIPQRPTPIPPPDSPSGQQPSAPARTQPQPDPKSQDAQMPSHSSQASTITGTIVRSGDKYILQTKDKAVYELDDQEEAKKYEGKQVKITGTLDLETSIIHVSNIELLS